ncbi:hypothetical protein SDC9_154579 [bioreactor metagenome]|uniref:Uncharacterized protein n=1 Tax=bioreactor metagenome TaxID=1076179 RepID=A0A645F417_9ZZZZ
MLDHQHGVARLHQPLQHSQQHMHVVGVQAGGGLVQNINGGAGGALG